MKVYFPYLYIMFDYDDGYGDDDYDEDEELHIIAMTEMHMHTMSGDCHCKPERVDNSYVHKILSLMAASEYLTEVVPISKN